jgi:hypothetical protein
MMTTKGIVRVRGARVIRRSNRRHYRAPLVCAVSLLLLAGLHACTNSTQGPPFPEAVAAERVPVTSPAQSAGSQPAARDAVTPAAAEPRQEPPAGRSVDPEAIEIGIAYGTEKRNWLEWAAQEFSTTEDGRRIRVNLLPFGSVEGARAVLNGDESIHVWSPASGLYRGAFVRDWQYKYRRNPIISEDPLAMTPMVIVMWKERYDAFTVKSPEVSLKTIFFAMRAKSGWGRIANRPEWGLFKFGHTHPDQSNSGLVTLLILSHSYFDKTRMLSVDDISSPRFHEYLAQFERGVTGLSNSTGVLMKEMIAKGPSGFDAVMVYENLAIDFFRSGDSNSDKLQVIYPKTNLWNDHPYCILDTPWTTRKHQQAAEVFRNFLLSAPVQLRALDFGFRPGNAAVSVTGPDSPFEEYASFGLHLDVEGLCEIPPVEVIDGLQQVWLRHAVPR